MKGIKQINIQIITETEEFAIQFLNNKKIVDILADKKTLMSTFLKELIKLK